MALIQSEERNPLDLSLLLKRAEEYLEGKRKALIPEANKAFRAITGTSPGCKRWQLMDGLGTVERYTPKCTWVYPPEVAKLEAQLQAARKDAQRDITRKRLPEVDPATQPLFALTVVKR